MITYVTNLENVELIKHGGEFICLPKKAKPDKPIEMGRTAGGRFFTNIEDFRPAVFYITLTDLINAIRLKYESNFSFCVFYSSFFI
jgi:hypothetical protein